MQGHSSTGRDGVRAWGSATPPRDAIQLEIEGFVTILPRRGVVVNELDLDSIRHIYEIIGALEGAAVVSWLVDWARQSSTRCSSSMQRWLLPSRLAILVPTTTATWHFTGSFWKAVRQRLPRSHSRESEASVVRLPPPRAIRRRMGVELDPRARGLPRAPRTRGHPWGRRLLARRALGLRGSGTVHSPVLLS